MVEYTGNCVTIFFYICKNDLLQQLTLRETHFIVKVVEKLRFFIGILLEDLRLKEKDFSYSSNKFQSSKGFSNDQTQLDMDFKDDKKHLEIHNRVKQLYARKLHKKVADVTRESKVKLSNHNLISNNEQSPKKISDMWKSVDQMMVKKMESKKEFENNVRKNHELQNS